MTRRNPRSRPVVDAVTDAVIAALLPADRRLSMAAAEHRDRPRGRSNRRCAPPDGGVGLRARSGSPCGAGPSCCLAHAACCCYPSARPRRPPQDPRAAVPVTADREARFQGSRLTLHVDAEAAVQLRDVLDRIARLEPSTAATAQLELRLPDGRPLRVAVRLADTGTVRDPHRSYVSSDGVAYADVSGDFEGHVVARRAIDAATRPYLEVPRSHEVAAAYDAARVDQALDRRVPAPDPPVGVARDAMRARALRAAARTRGQRIADAVRRERDLGIERGL